MNSGARAFVLALPLFAAALGPGAAPTPARADEALVLSGGGARGLAHAGVVLGMERRGHDPGIVVGTSMGSIVGALYAAGYGAQAIDSILEYEDWRAIFTPFPFEVGSDRSLRYPVLRLDTSGTAPFGSRAYIPDWRINRRLTQLLFEASARARGDFDRLPRRFRSVTADAETGDLIPLASGDLARAVRASMAAAGFFAPVRWRGPAPGASHASPLLTDGGIADYLPVAEARRMGGAPVIASDVLLPPARLPTTDAIAVARRSTELLSIHARKEPVAPDLLILPALDPGLAPFNYPVEPAPVIDAGLQSTLAAIPDSAAPATSPRPEQPEPDSLSGLAIEDGGIPETPDTRLHAFLWRAFEEHAPGRYRADRILAKLDRLYATGLFEGVWPSVEAAPDSTRAPILRVRAESRGLVSVAGALGYDNDRGGRIWASLRRLDAVGSHPLEIALEGSANGVEQSGSVSARLTSLLWGASAWTAGARFGEKEARFLEARGGRGGIETSRAGGWFGFETRRIVPAFHAAAAFRAEQIESDFGPEGASYGPWLKIEGEPRLLRVVGVAPSVEAEARFGDVSYRRAGARGSVAHALGPALAALVADVAAVSREAPIDAAPSMGGEGLIPGLRDGERLGRARAVLGVDLAVPAAFHSTFRLRARGGVIADETRAARGVLYSREHLAMGGVRLSGLWWTPFGPIEVGGEGSTLGDRRVVVIVGADF